MPNYKQFAANLLSRNPNVANSPQGRALVDILRSNDDARGRQMAANICQEYGVSEEEAARMAMSRFFNQ